MPPAARPTDNVTHPLPPVLTPGPGSFTVLTGMLPQWRGVPAAAAAVLQAAKKVVDATIKTLEAATKATAGTPAGPAALAAENAGKAAATSAMTSLMNSVGMGADIHMCATPSPVPPHGPGMVIDGSSTVLVNNLPAARMGDTLLEAIGPPNKIAKGHPTTHIGGAAGTGFGGMGGLVAALVTVITSQMNPTYPRTQVVNGQVVTEYSENVYVTGTNAEQQETIRQLNAIRASEGGDKFFEDLAKKDEPQMLSVLGNPAKGREVYPGKQKYENCIPQSAQQIIHVKTGTDHSAADMENFAWGPPDTGYKRASGTPQRGVDGVLNNAGVPAHQQGQSQANIDQALADGKGVMTVHKVGDLWNDPKQKGYHAVFTTGAVQNQNGETLGYTYTDTGKGIPSKVVSKDDFMGSTSGHNMGVTDDPIW